MRALLILGPTALALAACAPAADPCASANRDVNLATLIGNSASGNYNACLDTMRAELNALRVEAASLREQSNALDRQAAQLTGERAAAARRLADLNTEQARLLDTISRADSSSIGAAQAVDQANALNADINALNANGGAAAADAAEIAQRQARLNQLADIMLGAPS